MLDPRRFEIEIVWRVSGLSARPEQLGCYDRIFASEFKLMVTLLFTSVGRAMEWLRKRVQQRAVGSPVALAQAGSLPEASQSWGRSNQLPASAVPFVAVAKEVYPELSVPVELEAAQVGKTSRRGAVRAASCGGSQVSRCGRTEVLAQPSTRVNRPSSEQARRALLAPRASVLPRKATAQPRNGPAPSAAAPKSAPIPVDPIFGVWPRRPHQPWN